jgi:uroporphyrinogen decarboxylase
LNSLERVQAVLTGKIPDRVPVCLHNFMLAARESDVPMERYRIDPEAIATVHLRALDKYGHDCLLIDTDTTMMAEAMGAKSACAPGETGRIVAPAIQGLAEVKRLHVVNPETDGRIPAILEGVRLLAKQIGKEVAIRGNADAMAFSLACEVRGIEDFLMDLAESPDNPDITQLIEVCYQSHLAVHRALVKAGAHFTSCGDSLGGPDVVSPATFRRFVRPFEERLVRDLAQDGIFPVFHICGDTTNILSDLSEYDRCGFELDYKTDVVLAKNTAGARHVLFGNIDPSGVVARGTVQEVREKTRELIAAWKPGGHFVLNAGCAIPPTTPAENIRAMIEMAHQAGLYGHGS